MKVAVALILVGSWLSAYSQKAETAFIIPEKDLIPEGIAYDAISKSFFVSSIYKKKIVRIDSKGKIRGFVSSSQDGIGQVLGLKVANGKLWACSNNSSDAGGTSMIHQYDVTSGKLIRKWILPFTTERHLFNDMAIVNNEAYISDSENGSVFRVSEQSETPELFLKDKFLRDINGIALLKDDQLVVNASIGFFTISLSSKEIKQLSFEGYFPLGIDGLCKYKQSLIGIQNVGFPFSINRYFLNSVLDKIESAKVLLADHPQFKIPTTGVIVEDTFYFIANSQLSNLDGAKIKNEATLEKVLIMKIPLK
jgi:hypothetical protein